MESKLGRVHNLRGKSMLLIEPVWNRNNVVSIDRLPREEAFNRTSMESKQLYVNLISLSFLIF